MSRYTIYYTDKITLVSGMDHILGPFLNLIDIDQCTEANDEGIIYSWSQLFKVEINNTNLSGAPEEICLNYIKNKIESEDLEIKFNYS